MGETISRWDFGVDVHAPCADISFSTVSGRRVVVVCHFLRVNGGIPQDLELIFDQCHAFSWHDEALHSVSTSWQIATLPKIPDGAWAKWTYPFLRVDDSPWIKKFDYMPHVKGHVHLSLVAMNDIVELVADPAPRYRWIDA